MNNPYHFFVSAICGWGTGETLNEAVHNFEASVRKGLGQGKHFLSVTVFMVPGSNEETNYEINFFAPQVEGAKFIGYLELNKGMYRIRSPKELADEGWLNAVND